MARPPLRERTPLYEQLAAEIAGQIEGGTFRPGERIPSIRQSSRQRSLSLTTVMQAYGLLEDRGLIEARPQSGYFVRWRPEVVFSDPGVTTASLDPSLVSIDDLAMRVLQDSVNPALVQFGKAFPDPDLLPTARLNRILASVARNEQVPQNFSGLPGGCDELRTQVAQRAFLSGCNLSPDEILITSGCMEAISLSLRVVCKPGDLVAIESPTYYGVLQALESQGLRALEIPTHPTDGISLEALRFALEHHRISACLVISNFNNPLGSRMPDSHKSELVKLLARCDIPLIEDDINGELYFDSLRPRVAKASDRKGLVLLCSSFSKDISPSYRVGWVAPGRFKNQIERLKMASNVGTSILPQLAIAIFLSSGGYDHHLRRIRRAYAQKVAAMSQSVARTFPAETRVTHPSGGFVLWVQLPEKVDSLEMYQRALKAKITLAPGYIFSATPKYRNFIRLNAANWSPSMEGALQRLGQIASQLAR